MRNLCKDLEAYHDGELPPADQRHMREHVKNCPACAAELAELRAMESMLTARFKDDRDISAAVLSRIPKTAPQRPAGYFWQGWWKVPAMALASCALTLVLLESGLIPYNSYMLTAAITGQREALKLTGFLFGKPQVEDDKLLALLFDGGEK